MRYLSLAIAFVLVGLSSCKTSQSKPIASNEIEATAKPKLELYLQRVLAENQDTSSAQVSILGAELFHDGYYHESWRLKASVDGTAIFYALKIYPNMMSALKSQQNYHAADKFGWPIPQPIAWTPTTEPYVVQPSLLMEYVPQRTLADHMRTEWGRGEKVDVALLTAFYSSLGAKLGALHRASSRPRQPLDMSGTMVMHTLIKKCSQLQWCGSDARKRFTEIAPQMDGATVSFVHGDIYETHVTLDKQGKLVKFLGMHDAMFADPGWDVGIILAHMLLINPIAREATFGVSNPSAQEIQATTHAFLNAYRQGAGMESDEQWQALLQRARGYMWLRLGVLLARLQKNAHAQTMIQVVDSEKAKLFVADPLDLLLNTPVSVTPSSQPDTSTEPSSKPGAATAQ